ILATRGTAEFLNAQGVSAEGVLKVNEGRPNVVDRIKSGGIHLIINTPLGRESFYDDGPIRTNAILHGVLCVTTLTGAAATVQGIRALRKHIVTVATLQEIHESAAPADFRRGGAAPAPPSAPGVLVPARAR
ncbi:MAG TPA: hypothetical protein VN972_06315, partial [Methylomirabilota bacterium]|nr:hypothetical protein [Methylomirabilota bacterium]